ncbi:TPA: hypothetical protein I8Z14_002620 [Legionella pneumophila]|nr:hypothetical protein [Legionella pneumophila]
MKNFLYKTKNLSLLLVICALPKIAIGDASSTELQNEPPDIGNFALPASQQPGPFLSFGQSLIDKNQIQFYVSPNYLHYKNEHYLTISPSVVYGISNQASFLVTEPVAANYVNETSRSNGLGDTYFQGEYAFYENSNFKYVDQMTFVGGLTAPTGSAKKEPSTGFGSVSYFLGGTYNRMFVDWFGLVSSGLNVITKHDGMKLGNQYLYQVGLGRNIKSETGKYIFFGLVEMHGVYSEKDKFIGEVDLNSGGNLVNIIPSLWFSTKKLFFQVGVSIPISQTPNGEQNKIKYNPVAVAGITFN